MSHFAQTIAQCRACGFLRSYPKPICPQCHSPEAQSLPIPDRGRVYSFSVVHRAPTPALAQEVPYTIALIDLDLGQVLRLPARVLGEVSCGDLVERVVGDQPYPLFRKV